MQSLPYLVSAVGLGVIVAYQPLMNAMIARAIGSSFGAALISILVTLAGIVLVTAVAGRGEISRATLGPLPWWVFLSGFIGTAFVAGGALIAPVTGSLVFVMCIVAGQLVGATLADHLGLFGIAVREVTPLRLVGLALVASGAVIALRN
ncbi:MAG: DMT family transporter [Amaricoccus sp.]|uniref:DMT family transporter n=1 Tax=Amaricoccus sp. TaxID=1872485 RepID=UPI0039E46871